MYGYVRPDREELRVREYRQFRAVYCGLCGELKRRCGPAARFVVNYDLTFMAMVLSDGPACLERRRCPVHPFRKHACLAGGGGLAAAADYSVILAWWKLRDNVRDEGPGKRLLFWIPLFFLRRAYRRAARARPGFDACVREKLTELARLEQEGCPVLDRAADCFAEILAFAAEDTGCPERRRVQRELFYHVGRMVYILDAADDLPEDVRRGRYNPLAHRFSPSGGELPAEAREEIRATLNLSQRCAWAALALLEENPWHDILENTVTRGLPGVAELVLSGAWRSRDKRKNMLFRGEVI